MIDVLSLPVEEPGSFIFFIFIPGFLAYLSLQERYSSVKEFFGLKIVFGKRIDALIWSIMLGIVISILVSAFYVYALPCVYSTMLYFGLTTKPFLKPPELLIFPTIVGSASIILSSLLVISSFGPVNNSLKSSKDKKSKFSFLNSVSSKIFLFFCVSFFFSWLSLYACYHICYPQIQ